MADSTQASTVHISFDENDFRALISGEIVEKRSVSGQLIRVILSDIGYVRMMRIIAAANHIRIPQ